MRNFRSWRNFILQTYSARFEEMLAALDSVDFESLDTRLLRYLSERESALDTQEFHITHQQIAQELNSSREAVSRLLMKFDTNGKIQLVRYRIKILSIT